MTTLVVLACVFFVWATLIAPFIDAAWQRHKRDRAELLRCGGRVRVAAPRFDRPTDPSPRVRPRRDRDRAKAN